MEAVARNLKRPNAKYGSLLDPFEVSFASFQLLCSIDFQNKDLITRTDNYNVDVLIGRSPGLVSYRVGIYGYGVCGTGYSASFKFSTM